MNLLEGEEILHEGPGKRVILTNKRLITQKKKGFFSSELIIETEYPLSDIEEAYNKGGGFFGPPTLNLKLKNGESFEFPVAISGGDSLNSLLSADYITDSTARQNAVNDRWASAINNQLRKMEIEQLKNTGLECPSCKKSIPQGNFSFCPFCGNSFKV